MGQFTYDRKEGSSGIAGVSQGYYVKYDGNYVMRQQADGTWVRFETLDANFNTDSFYELDRNLNPVHAKFLTYNGEYVRNAVDNPLGNPIGNLYIAPYDFYLEDFIAKYKGLSQQMLAVEPNKRSDFLYGVMRDGFWPGKGIDDLQTSYGGTNGRTFVISFTSVASFTYGAASNLMGITKDESIIAGGIVNVATAGLSWPPKDVSGEKGNNPNNPNNIKSGHDFVGSLGTPNSSFYKAVTNNNSKDVALSNYSETYYIETADTRRAVGSDELSTAARNLKPGESLVCIAGNGTTYWGIQQTTGVPTSTLQTTNNTDPGAIQVGQRLVVATSSPSVSSITNNTPVSAASGQTSQVDFTSATFAQKFQYNFQTILGPTNPAFIDATLNSQDIDYNFRLDYNPNGVLWRVDAAGRPHPYDSQNLLIQNEVIQTATNKTITEMQGSGDFPVVSSDLA
ncbi:MAG: hypothetical protein P4N59_12300 [Negativicutes bacterium]|nr:hypothetical protein [Negativicutes bacterium]